MKKSKYILAAVPAVVLLTLAGLAVCRKDHLKPLYNLPTNDSQSISQGIEEKPQAQTEKSEQDFNIAVQAPTADQNSDLLDGKTTPEEVKEALGLTQLPEAATTQEGTSPANPAEQPPIPESPPLTAEAQAEKLVNQCVAELYAYEVDLMAEMGEMKKTALLDWNSRSPSERTKSATIEFGFMWLTEVYKVEARADRNVTDILDRYRAQLEELQVDTSVLDDMWKYYCDKKSNTKAYYLNKYLN